MNNIRCNIQSDTVAANEEGKNVLSKNHSLFNIIVLSFKAPYEELQSSDDDKSFTQVKEVSESEFEGSCSSGVRENDQLSINCKIDRLSPFSVLEQDTEPQNASQRANTFFFYLKI